MIQWFWAYIPGEILHGIFDYQMVCVPYRDGCHTYEMESHDKYWKSDCDSK